MSRRLGALAVAVVVLAAVLASIAPTSAPAAVDSHAAATSGPPSSARRTAAVRASGSAPGWKPKPGLRWQYQLQGKVNTAVCAPPVQSGACVRPDVWVIDLYTDDGTTTNAAVVKEIHARKKHAVCYVDAGTWENWRPDAARFPAKLRGKGNGWPGELWLDIRAITVLKPLIAARVDKCVKAGFDAVDFDNVEGYANDTGFPLTGAHQLAFNRMLAKMVHGRGLAVGLKNDLGQAAKLRGDFDFAVNEQCFAFHECARYDGWTESGRPVVEIEYEGNTAHLCAAANAKHRDAMRKALALKATPWTPCR
jgi:hypothetical protein